MPSAVPGTRLPPPSRPSEATPEIDLQTDAINIPFRLCNLPPFNAIASQVLGLTADPDIDLSHISRVIEGDPAFATDILLLANSPLFGFPSRMRVLRHAIALLGLERVKALAVTVAMRGFFGNRNPLIHQCWRHSAACALVCEEVSAMIGFSGDRAYTAGIMHDIGRLGLLKSYPKEMATVLTGHYLDTREVLLAEREALQVDHTRAGSWLVGAWAFPKDFSEVCANHHAAPSAGDSEILQLVRAACSIADAIGFPAVKCQRQPSYLEATAPLKLRPGRNAAPPEDDMRANVTARLAAFER